MLELSGLRGMSRGVLIGAGDALMASVLKSGKAETNRKTDVGAYSSIHPSILLSLPLHREPVVEMNS